MRLVEHPERFLNPVLLLMLLAHLVIASVVAVLIQRHFGSGLLFVATLVETAVIFVFAEAAPKTWAIEHPERSALLSAPLVAAVVNLLPIRVITRALIGVTNVILPGKGLKRGPFVSEQELLAASSPWMMNRGIFQIPADKGQWMLSVQHGLEDIGTYVEAFAEYAAGLAR